jgi:hypothetical protein
MLSVGLSSADLGPVFWRSADLSSGALQVCFWRTASFSSGILPTLSSGALQTCFLISMFFAPYRHDCDETGRGEYNL